MSGFLDFLSDPQTLNSIGGGLNAAGQIMGGLSHIQFGQEQLQAAQYRSDQLRRLSGQAMASAERSAWSTDLATKYITSKALAAAAGSGGGASDPSVVSVMAQTAAMGAYRKATELYQGADKARLLSMQADASDYEGQVSANRSEQTGDMQLFGAGTSLLKTYAKGASLFQRFGGNGPTTNSGFED